MFGILKTICTFNLLLIFIVNYAQINQEIKPLNSKKITHKIDSNTYIDSVYQQQKKDSIYYQSFKNRVNSSLLLYFKNNIPTIQKINQRLYNYVEIYAYPEKIKKHINKDAVFYFFIGLFLAFGLILYFYKDYYLFLFNKSIIYPLKKINFKNNFSKNNLCILVSNLFYILIFSTYCTILVTHFLGYNWTIIPFFIISITIIFCIKFAVYSFLKWLNNKMNNINLIFDFNFNLKKILVIILFPCCFVLALAYQNIFNLFFYLTIFIFAIYFIFKNIINILLLLKSKQISLFYIFLILICIELIPNLLIFKIIYIYLNINH